MIVVSLVSDKMLVVIIDSSFIEGVKEPYIFLWVDVCNILMPNKKQESYINISYNMRLILYKAV